MEAHLAGACETLDGGQLVGLPTSSECGHQYHWSGETFFQTVHVATRILRGALL